MKQTMKSLQPRSNDVLCGRGSTFDEHPGNKYFRQIVAKHKPQYLKAARSGKRDIAQTVIKELQHHDRSVRFLFRDLDTGSWCEADHKTAYNKTTQALRQMQKRKKREISSLPPPTRTISKSNHTDRSSWSNGVPMTVSSSSSVSVPQIVLSSTPRRIDLHFDGIPVQQEMQNYCNMLKSAYGPSVFPNATQISKFQHVQTCDSSVFALMQNKAKKNFGCHRTSNVSAFSKQTTVTAPSDLQKDTCTSTDWKSFTSDEIKYLTKMFLGEDNQDHSQCRSSSSDAQPGNHEHEEVGSSNRDQVVDNTLDELTFGAVIDNNSGDLNASNDVFFDGF